MAQWLRVFSALTEDTGSVTSTHHQAVHKLPITSAPGDPMPSGLEAPACMW